MIIAKVEPNYIVLEGYAFQVAAQWNSHDEWGGGWEDCPDDIRPCEIRVTSDIFVTVSGEEGCVEAEFELGFEDIEALLTEEQVGWFRAWLEATENEDAFAALPSPPDAPACFKSIRGVLAADAPEGEEIFVRLGGLPRGGVSRNHRDEEPELGVSCFRALRTAEGEVVAVLENAAQFATFIAMHRPALILEGEVVGVGADGEPVLAVEDVEIVEVILK